MFRLILILSCAFLGVLSASSSPKCKPNRACVTKASKVVYKNLLDDGNNQLDPMYQELIEGDFGTLKYSLIDTTIIGFKKCSPKDANLDFEKLVHEVEFYCPEFHVEGKYNVHGSLLDKPVEGNGEYTIDSKGYSVKILLNISLVTKGDKHYLHFNDFDLEPTPLEDIVYDFKNLFNGQKELADDLLKFINENSKAVAKELQGPLFRTGYKKIIDVSNTIFEVKPLENYFIL